MWPKVHLHSKLAKRSKKIDSITKKLFFRTLIVVGGRLCFSLTNQLELDLKGAPPTPPHPTKSGELTYK